MTSSHSLAEPGSSSDSVRVTFFTPVAAPILRSIASCKVLQETRTLRAGDRFQADPGAINAADIVQGECRLISIEALLVHGGV